MPTYLDALFPEVWHARRLGDLLRLVADSLQGVQTGTRVSLDIADGVALYSYRILDPTIWPRTRDAEFTLGFILGTVQFALGDAVEPHGIMFEHDHEAYGGRLDRFVGQACVYGETDNAIAFPAAMLDAPVFAGRESGPAGEPPSPDTVACKRPLVERVEACILGRIGHGSIDQGAIARDLGLSARSLRRRLTQEGTGYRAIVDRARMAYARNMLRGTAMPVHEIARRLDYDSLSAFSRAFHGHSGISPSAARRHALPARAETRSDGPI